MTSTLETTTGRTTTSLETPKNDINWKATSDYKYIIVGNDRDIEIDRYSLNNTKAYKTTC